MLLRACLLASAMLAGPPAKPKAHHGGVISGKVTDSRTDEPLEGALLVLQCTCLRGTRETVTDANGLYRFGGLPAGTYTLDLLFGDAQVTKVIHLPPRTTKAPG